jgi:hypothetical protein
MDWFAHKLTSKQLSYLIVVALILAGIGPFPASKASAAQLGPRSIRVSDAIAAQNNVTYRTALTSVTAAILGSVRIQFCSNTSLVDDSCSPPVGFDVTGAAIASQAGITDFSISSSSTINEIVLSRPPAMEGPTSMAYEFTGVTNPFTGGSYYARMYTYPTSDGSGSYTDAGGLALHYRPALGVSTEVPPHLTFCLGESITGFNCSTATEPFSDLGILGPLVTGLAQSQMLVATNADGGYSMWVVGNTMTAGNNIIPAMSGGVSQKGVSQFGINLRANTNPIIGQDISGPGTGTIFPNYSQQNQFRFNSGDVLASSTTPDDYRKYTVSYIVNVNQNQPGGLYSTTLTYITLANF